MAYSTVRATHVGKHTKGLHGISKGMGACDRCGRTRQAHSDSTRSKTCRDCQDSMTPADRIAWGIGRKSDFKAVEQARELSAA
jgi:hypothetical protein